MQGKKRRTRYDAAEICPSWVLSNNELLLISVCVATCCIW